MKTVIGLEIHVQLKTKSKMFCGCPNYTFRMDSIGYDKDGNYIDSRSSWEKPNTRTCPVCMGMPGTLPVANKQAIDWTIMTGLVFRSKINSKSKFDRKHYFYPDLPKGYQISQYDEPFCRGGWLEIEIDGKKRKIKLRRIHLEEDAGKLVHPKGANYSLVDLNRAGTPLMEIVTEPDIDSPQEAKLFLQKLRTILRHLGVSNANMEKGQMRCDANISISQQSTDGSQAEGTPVEIKNMNSFRAVERALTYEENRQKEAIKLGEKITKETRGWNEKKRITVSQRSKEYAEDYRYFPEPDLPPFLVTQDQILNIKNQISEDIDSISQKYQKIGIGQADVSVLTSNFVKKKYYDSLIGKLTADDEKVLAAKWLVNRFFEKHYPVDQYAVFIKKLSAGEIPSARAIEIIKKAYHEHKNIEQVIKELGLTKIDDDDKMNIIAEKVISENKKPVEDYKSGKKEALKFLVGQVMAKSKGQADPQKTEKILKEKLDK